MLQADEYGFSTEIVDSSAISIEIKTCRGNQTADFRCAALTPRLKSVTPYNICNNIQL